MIRENGQNNGYAAKDHGQIDRKCTENTGKTQNHSDSGHRTPRIVHTGLRVLGVIWIVLIPIRVIIVIVFHCLLYLHSPSSRRRFTHHILTLLRGEYKSFLKNRGIIPIIWYGTVIVHTGKGLFIV